MVFDSVAAAVAESELSSDVGDVNVASIAKLFAETLKKMTHPLFPTRTVVGFINQMRADIKMTGRMFPGMKLEKPTGGKAIKFYASVRLEVKKSQYVKEGNVIVGIKNQIEVVKNGVAEPFKTADYTFNFKHGVDVVSMLIEEAVLKKVITVNGSYFYFGEGDDAIKWLGRDKMISGFREDPALVAQLSAILGR